MNVKSKFRGDVFKEYSTAVGIVYALSDVVAVIAAGVLASICAFGYVHATMGYRTAVLVGVLLVLMIFTWFGLYESWRGRSSLDHARTTTVAWITAVSVLILLGFFLGVSGEFARGWLLWLVFWGWVFLLGVRLTAMLLLRTLRTRGWNHKRLLIVGAGDWGAEVISKLKGAPWLGMDVVALLDDDKERHGQLVAGCPVQGGLDRLPGLLERGDVDEVWVCLPLSSTRSNTIRQIDKALYLMRHSTITQRMVPKVGELRLMSHPVNVVMGLPVLNLNTSPMYGVNRFVKEVEDRLLSALILVIICPLMLLIALAVKLDSPGRVLFKQRRHGWDGKPINVYKFRTMHVHEENGGKVTQACRDDARITRVGRFLRRTSLDELPQFFNVLQGKMSVVGPRPHAIEHNEYYMDQIDSYMQRHRVKPGITGWAQVNGLRGETDQLHKMQKRVEYDLYYIENWSLWLDIKIIFLTLVRGFVHRNAY